MAVFAGEHENAGFNFLISLWLQQLAGNSSRWYSPPQTLHLPASLLLSLSLHAFVCPPLNLYLALLNCFECLSGQKEE